MFVKFLKYNVVQLLAYGLELSVFFFVLYLFPDNLLVSNVSAKGSAGVFAFFFHKTYTFKSNEKTNVKGEAVRYVLVLLGNTLLSTFLLLMLALYMPEWLSKITADVVSVGITFVVTQRLVFGYKKKS